MENKRRKGNIGEAAAVYYLQKKNYRILERNFYTRNGEVDVIAKKNNIIFFIEVKSRFNNINFKKEPIQSAVGFKKINRIKLAGEAYVRKNSINFDLDFKIEVITVVFFKKKAIIRHIKNIDIN